MNEAPSKQLAFEMREPIVGKGPEDIVVPYLVCLPLEEAGFANAFSTRLGGVSPFPEQALHLSFKNDKLDHVRENRRRFLKAMEWSSGLIATAEQTHSSIIHLLHEESVTEIRKNDQLEFPGDALLSKQPQLLLGVKTADCLPILIGDPETGTMAAVHAGWKGTLERIAEKTIERLANEFGVQPENCVVAMGPAACSACYEVGPEVTEPFKKTFPYADDLLSDSPRPTKCFLDVKLANAVQLLASGLSPLNIFGADECTMHENELFFSHRQEGKKAGVNVGRQLSVIGKKN